MKGNKSPLKESIKSVLRSVKKRGIVRTIIFSVNEIWFDVKFGVDTRSEVSSISSLNQGRNNAAQPYQGANFHTIKSVFSELKKITDLKQARMIDYGSGMGRAVLSGLYYGLDRVEGIELDRVLCEKCNKNIDKFCKGRGVSRNKAQCIFADAQLYEIPKGVNIFFLYNPFSSPVIDRVVDRIYLFAKEQKSDVFVVYINPIFRELFLEKNFVSLLDSDKEFDLYKYTP